MYDTIYDMPEYAKKFFYEQLDKRQIKKEERIITDFTGHHKLEHYMVGSYPDYSVEVLVILHEATITNIKIRWLEDPPKGENYRYLVKTDMWSNLLPDTKPEKKRFLYDMYIAAKNKYEGKPYFNPYKDKPNKQISTNMNTFKKMLDTKSENIFPPNMPNEERIAALNALQNVLYQHIAPYRTK